MKISKNLPYYSTMIKMKKILTLTLILIGTFQLSAQDHESHRERIKSLKTAHITEGLNLTPQEAQKFWPIYNDFEEKRRNLYRQEHAGIGNLECITEENADSMLNQYVELEKEDYLLKKKFYSDLRSIFSAKRIIQLKKVEDEFNRKIIKEYRERQAKNIK